MKSDLISKGFLLFSFCLFILSPNICFAEDIDELEFDEELELEDFELDDEELELEELDLDEDDLFEMDENIETLLEEFEVEEDGNIATDQFVFSGILGNTMPFGKNLKDKFSSGSNFGIRIDTPFYIFIGPFELNIGGEIYFSSMKLGESSCTDYENETDEDTEYYIGNCPYIGDYKLTNITGSLSTVIEGISLRTGFGLSSTSTGNENKTLITSMVDIGYKLPININPINISINLHLQETLGVPFADKGTSDMIGLGLIIGYPMSF